MKGLIVMPLLAATLLLGACATTVKPAYVSPTQYQSLNCQQLQSEYNRIQQYIDNGVQTPKRTGVGLGLGLGGGWGRGGWGFGPSVSVNLGQSSETKNTELSRVLGQQEAIAQAAQFKNCPMIVRKKSTN
ncbi:MULTISPECIES: hypothetical protein [Acinetobacter]|nr:MULTISPECIES: hypothetical protein [Acinetobacter]ENV53008.1 hypothetical protein F952_02835 [Acinetobacter baylyi DSM 14961 = CIP 107474]MAK31104.1 hypothetical protein [Acinetobacter sp.]MDQ1209367.1 hypothetical protein [Acinetobacter baylyi]MDR6107040.1 hypothetical protein [Acinetobacter baylyi]MDR6186239.1 hypothetical protein [Acinetobacter baylyi]